MSSRPVYPVAPAIPTRSGLGVREAPVVVSGLGRMIVEINALGIPLTPKNIYTRRV